MGGLHIFTLAGIPVQVSGWYLVLLFYMGRHDPRIGMLWAACVTVSILAHEFGHGMVARRLGLTPSIMLHGWGGLCSHDRAKSDRDDVFIIAAGPGVGLIVGGLVWGLWRFVIPVAAPEMQYQQTTHYLFESLIYINIWWSLLNLLPLWPLDGGQLFRMLMLRICSSGATAERITHGIGLALAGGGALYGYAVLKSTFLAIIGAFLAYQNFTRFGESSTSGPVRSKSRLGNALLKEARAAMDGGDHREAVRLCHQIRADSRVSEKQMGAVWEILGVGNVELGDFEEAEYWLEQAPDTPAVQKARAQVQAHKET